MLSLYGNHICQPSFLGSVLGDGATSRHFIRVVPAVEGGSRGLVARRFGAVPPSYGYTGQRLSDLCACWMILMWMGDYWNNCGEPD